MKLIQITPSELNWGLDFKPRKSWPVALPVVAVLKDTKPLVVAGFERQTQTEIAALIISQDAQQCLASLWPEDSLMSFEKLRLSQCLDLPNRIDTAPWPLAFQNYCDDRKLGMKSLQPLNHLKDWAVDLTNSCLTRTFSSSQLRELFDILTDLKMAGHAWLDLAPQAMTDAEWIKALKTKRHPITAKRDLTLQNRVAALAWPKGVHAHWERQGDQGTVSVGIKLTQPRDWKRLTGLFEKIEIGEDFWKTEI